MHDRETGNGIEAAVKGAVVQITGKISKTKVERGARGRSDCLFRLVQQSLTVVESEVRSFVPSLKEGFGEVPVAAAQIENGTCFKQARKERANPGLDGKTGRGKRLRVAIVKSAVKFKQAVNQLRVHEYILTQLLK